MDVSRSKAKTATDASIQRKQRQTTWDQATVIGATLFSGIGAPEVAMPHWDWRWCAEIDKFACAVLQQRHPDSVNLGDVTAHDFVERAAAVAKPDVLVFGSPCQSFSVAGQRLGLDDPRGNLALVALGIVDRLKPRWFVFENVPGLMSSADGSDFGLFLRTVDELGYCCAWSVLDAQFFGVAQRRERVFVVGHLGDWQRAAAVLLEPEGVRGHHPPRRAERKGIAPTISARTRGGGGLGTDFDCDGGLIVSPDTPDIAFAIQERAVCENPDAGPDGVGVRDDGAAYTLEARTVPQAVAFDARQSDVIQYGDKTGPLDTDGHSMAVAFTQNTRDEVRLIGGDGGVVGALAAEPGVKQQSYVACYDITGTGDGMVNGGRHTDIHTPLRSRAPGHSEGSTTTVVAFKTDQEPEAHGDLCPTLHQPSPSGGGQQHAVMTGWMVRRLTPTECERLQGFPDGYTAVPYRGKQAADGPRYKALGNAMAVPVVRWILQRIEKLERDR